MTDDFSHCAEFKHMCGARRCCVSFHKRIPEDVCAVVATSLDNVGPLVLQMATREKRRPSLHEYLAIRKASPARGFGFKTNEPVIFYKVALTRAKSCDKVRKYT